MEFVLYWPTIPGACPRLWLIYPMALHFPLCQWISIADSFLVRGGTLCAHPSFWAGTPSGLNICRSSVCFPRSLWMHISIGPVVCEGHCPWSHPWPPTLTIFLPLLLHRSLGSGASHLGLSTVKSLFLCSLFTHGSHVNSHLHQEEESMMRLDQGTDLSPPWLQWYESQPSVATEATVV